MVGLVNEIIAPYFDTTKAELGLDDGRLTAGPFTSLTNFYHG
jgi:hypothetical protein